MSTLVIVESPTKARTISNYLPSGYRVQASMGHIRDLPASAEEIPPAHKDKSWANLGVDVENDFDPLYVVPKTKSKVVKELKEALKGASELILATDEDREGESISWHLLQVLNPKIPTKRMVFHEITKEAIQAALKNCRSIDEPKKPAAYSIASTVIPSPPYSGKKSPKGYPPAGCNPWRYVCSCSANENDEPLKPPIIGI